VRERGRLQPIFHDVVIDYASLLFDEFAGREDSEVRDAAYVIACGKLLVFVGVDFENHGLAGEVFCGARNFRGCGAAGTAPVGPKVDEDGYARALDDFVEECGVDLQGFVKRGEWVFACTAPASVRQMVCGYTVFLATGGAGSDGRHGWFLLIYLMWIVAGGCMGKSCPAARAHRAWRGYFVACVPVSAAWVIGGFALLSFR
jgi:hypothetical protein